MIDPAFTWGDDRPPRTPWHKTVIYELHVKGFTQLNPQVPENLRGSYAGLASESAIKHLTDLGVTAVELLPVHHHLDDRHLVEKGLRNYWGYNTLAFFAPSVDLLLHEHRAGRRAAVQDDGAGHARRGPRGDSRRGLQPHRRGQPDGADALDARRRQRRLLPPGSPTRATTWTSPAPATR